MEQVVEGEVLEAEGDLEVLEEEDPWPSCKSPPTLRTEEEESLPE